MARETGQMRQPGELRREIEATRREIDQHLRELGSEVRSEVRTELDFQRQVKQNTPQLLAGAAILGLAAGVLFGSGGGRSRESKELAREQKRLTKEMRALSRERGRLQGAIGLAEIEEPELGYDIP